MQRLEIFEKCYFYIFRVKLTVYIFDNSLLYVNNSQIFLSQNDKLLSRMIAFNPQRRNFLLKLDTFLNLCFLIEFNKIYPWAKHSNFA